MNNPDPETTWGTVVDGIIVGILLVAATIALTACASHTVHGGDYPRVEQTGTFTAAELYVELGKVFGPEAVQRVQGENVRRYATYRPEDYVAVMRNVTLPNNPPWAMSYLCVQFAQQARLDMQRAAVLSGSTEAPAAIGWFGVRNVVPWAGVADGRHALNTYIAGARGEMTAWVVEPQNGIRVQVARQDEDGEWVVDWSAYPNLPHVEFVKLEL